MDYPQETARPLKPYRVVHKAERGAQLYAIGATATIRAHAEQHMIRDYEIPLALLPAGATVGDALVVTVTGAFPYTITAVRGSRFCGSGPGTDQVGAVARGDFHPGHIEYSADEGKYWP